MIQKRTVRLGAALAATALVAAGCLSDGGSNGDGGDGDGRVEIVGAQSGGTADALRVELALLSEELGIEVTYATIPDFDTVIHARVRGGNAPDIALFPQPGIMFDLAESGQLAALDDVIDVAAIGSAMIPGLADIVSKDGRTYGLPGSISVKSLVWVPTAFEEAGYAVPADTDELLALTEQIKADGTPPWCFAFEAQAATGWNITDWIEEYVLRIGGPEVYDQWITNEIPFNGPRRQAGGGGVRRAHPDAGQRRALAAGDGRHSPGGCHGAARVRPTRVLHGATGQLHHRLLAPGGPGESHRPRRHVPASAASRWLRRPGGPGCWRHLRYVPAGRPGGQGRPRSDLYVGFRLGVGKGRAVHLTVPRLPG